MRVLTNGMRAKQQDRALAVLREKHHFLASLVPPLIVAMIVAGGLVWLAFANLDGHRARPPRFEHTAAIQKLFFRGTH